MYSRDNLESLLNLATYTSADLNGKTVVIRSCLNVPLDKLGVIQDDTRLKESLPTIQKLASFAGKVLILGHLGRPQGRDASMSLLPIKQRLSELLGEPVNFIEDVSALKDQSAWGKINLLENVRFFPGEESKNEAERLEFAKQLAQGDIFVNDAFPDYRASASTFELAKVLPSYLGETFVNEIRELGKFKNPQRPYVAVIGGAKLSEKLDVLLSLLKDADKVLIGGAMAYTLLKANGIDTGNSLVEEDKLDVAREILANANDKLLLPIDHLAISGEFKEPAYADGYINVNEQKIAEGLMAVDIGPMTTQVFVQQLLSAGSILWNGPMGVFEWDGAGKGTQQIGSAIAANPNAYKLAGGGDTISAISKYGLSGFNHISTGGGAMSAFVAYSDFPTLDVVLERFKQ